MPVVGHSDLSHHTLGIDLQICPELDQVDGVDGGAGGGLSGWSLAQTGSD
jgi:hypothetical protein